MPASIIPLKQGMSATLQVRYMDADRNLLDLSSGYTARMQLRSSASQDFVDELTTENSRITCLDGADNYNIKLTWTTAEAAALPVRKSSKARYLADLELITAGEVIDSIRFVFEVTEEMTK